MRSFPARKTRRENQELETNDPKGSWLSPALYHMKTDRIIQTLKEPVSILGTFIALKAIAIVYSFSVKAPWYMFQVRLAEFIVLVLVSYYVIKGRIFALWAMGIYLVIHVFAVFLAIYVIPIDQYVVKIITIILSLYFVFGGMVLIRSARAKTTRK